MRPDADARRARRRREHTLAVAAFVVVLIGSTAVGVVVADGAAPGTATASSVAEDPAVQGEAPVPEVTEVTEVTEVAPVRTEARTRSPEDAGGGPEPGPGPDAPLAHSQPTAIRIPSLDVSAGVLELGLHDDGTMEVPPHAPEGESEAGWYRHSPTPGSLGPSVIVGHVDSDRHGPSVFYGLDALAAGDRVEIDREDGTTAVFAVERTERYAKDEFPHGDVYGNLDHAGLRLITCGGDFDRGRLEYTDNVVVYARLISSHPVES